jgi:hypothetical protein
VPLELESLVPPQPPKKVTTARLNPSFNARMNVFLQSPAAPLVRTKEAGNFSHDKKEINPQAHAPRPEILYKS